MADELATCAPVPSTEFIEGSHALPEALLHSVGTPPAVHQGNAVPGGTRRGHRRGSQRLARYVILQRRLIAAVVTECESSYPRT